MKTRIFIVSAVLAACFSAISCNEDRLDIEQKGSLGTSDDYYTTDDHVESGISAAYAVWGFELFELQNMLDNLSDDMWTSGGGATDYSDLQTLNAYTFGSDNANIKNRFTHLYTLIYDANLILDNVPKNDTVTDVMKRAMSEAYFFRGWAYLYLGAAWGNVPIVDHVLSSSEYHLTNSTQEEVLTQAVNDFTQAIEYGGLSTKPSLGYVEKRITDYAAMAFLGKAYLQMNDYADAATWLNKVIDSGVYALEDGSSYGDLLKPATEDGDEVIALRYTANTTVTQDWTAHQGMNNYYSDGVERGWRNDHFTWTAASAQSDTINLIMPGYGECSPRADLATSMKEWELENGGDLTRYNNTVKDYDWCQTQGLDIVAGMTFYGNEGYWNWKNRFLKEEVISSYGYGGWNVWIKNQWRAMRYAEVLLMAAEANFQSGDTDKALEEINLIRERAGETAATSVTMDMIKNEKRFELCFEGCRWLDLVRWGDAATVLADQGKVIYGFNDQGEVFQAGTNATGGFQSGKHELLPIPETELLVNPNIQQNPGWGSE